MAIKVKNGYACAYCKKVYNQYQQADECKLNHDLIYVALSKTDLNRLVNFIYLKDDALLTPTLIDTLRSYLRGNR